MTVTWALEANALVGRVIAPITATGVSAHVALARADAAISLALARDTDATGRVWERLGTGTDGDLGHHYWVVARARGQGLRLMTEAIAGHDAGGKRQ